MLSNHLILCCSCPFSSCLQSFLASRSFPMSQFFASGGLSIGASASASIFPVKFRVDFLYDWLVWSPCCPRDSNKPVSEWVKSFSRVWLFATPRTVAHQAPLSMGFSRQEYWSGLPFPSGIFPTQGSNLGLPHCGQTQADALTSEPLGKSKQCLGNVAQSGPTLYDPMDYSPCLLQPTRRLHPWKFPGKSTGVGCHFLLKGIFPTWGSNLGFLHCGQTLYYLSHQGIPKCSTEPLL